MIGFWVSDRFREKCRIPSDSDADLESVTSLLWTCLWSVTLILTLTLHYITIVRFGNDHSQFSAKIIHHVLLSLRDAKLRSWTVCYVFYLSSIIYKTSNKRCRRKSLTFGVWPEAQKYTGWAKKPDCFLKVWNSRICWHKKWTSSLKLVDILNAVSLH